MIFLILLVSEVKRFVEKPNATGASKMFASGNYLWNAGIFLFRAVDMIDAFNAHAPNTLELVSKSVNNASKDLEFLCLAKEPWSKLENISIDYAIMEKVQNLAVVPYASKWSDLGGWDAVWSESNPDADGNVISENAFAVGCYKAYCALKIKIYKSLGWVWIILWRLPCLTQYLLLIKSSRRM